MPESSLVDANCEIIIRDENLEDAGAIRNLIKFDSTLRLNEVSSWQIDMHTDDFMALNANGGSFGLGSGIMFRRDNVQILSGPVMLVKPHYLAGNRTTTIFGGCDNAWLQTRICYPKVEGMIYEDGMYRFAQKRLADGLTTVTTEVIAVGDSKMTVKDASGFLPGATIQLGTGGKTNIATIDYPQNVLNFKAVFSSTYPIGTAITQSGTGSSIVDDPAFLGYDVRVDKAETVMKELVYYNAGAGACVDKFGSRAIPHLVVPTNFGRGNTVTSNVRGENLLSQIQSLAIIGQLNFQVTQVDTDLVFDVFIGEDLTKNDDLVFSVEARNLKEYEFSLGLPDANMLIGVGPYIMLRDETGKFTAKTTHKGFFPSADLASMAQFGRFEGWINASQGNAGETADDIKTYMDSQNQMTLLTTANNSSLSISLQETDQVRFPRDFNVGSKVVIMIGDEPTEQVVTNVNYSIPGGAGGSGSAVAAFTQKQMSRVMTRQNRQGDLIKQLMLNS
jgi:hypothetical protein